MTNIPRALDPFVLSVLADPVSKQAVTSDAFAKVNDILDARVFLKNTNGNSEWADGQTEYEKEFETSSAGGKGYEDQVKSYLAEIAYDRPIHEHFHLNGAILDVGGGVGTVREFLPQTIQFVSIYPYIKAPQAIQSARREAYECLSRPLNFIAATAEFSAFDRRILRLGAFALNARSCAGA